MFCKKKFERPRMGHLEMIINIWAVKKDSFLGGSFCIFCTFCIFFLGGGIFQKHGYHNRNPSTIEWWHNEYMNIRLQKVKYLLQKQVLGRQSLSTNYHLSFMYEWNPRVLISKEAHICILAHLVTDMDFPTRRYCTSTPSSSPGDPGTFDTS